MYEMKISVCLKNIYDENGCCHFWHPVTRQLVRLKLLVMVGFTKIGCQLKLVGQLEDEVWRTGRLWLSREIWKAEIRCSMDYSRLRIWLLFVNSLKFVEPQCQVALE
jgi:hypothetical protein